MWTFFFRSAIIVFALLLTAEIANAQKEGPCTAGIYKTREDLVKNRISHKINTGDKGFKFGFLFPTDLKLTIKIDRPDTTLEFPPGSVYGYHKCGRAFRYFAGGDLLAQEDFYRIEEKAGLVIYTSAFVSGNEVFYSRDLASPIRRLLLKNIEEDFADHTPFLDAVRELNRKLPDGISSHNEKRQYDINRIYAGHFGGKPPGQGARR